MDFKSSKHLSRIAKMSKEEMDQFVAKPVP
jgi:hypothetical protein